MNKRPSKKKPKATIQSYNYKSKLEEKIAKQLKDARCPFDYEPIKVEYTLFRFYKPDFRLNSGILIETKGHLDYEDREKMIAVKEENPELDIRFVFETDGYINKLTKSAKKKRLDIRSKSGKITADEIKELNKDRTKYSDWAKEHGFLYAIGKIPQEWLDE